MSDTALLLLPLLLPLPLLLLQCPTSCGEGGPAPVCRWSVGVTVGGTAGLSVKGGAGCARDPVVKARVVPVEW